MPRNVTERPLENVDIPGTGHPEMGPGMSPSLQWISGIATFPSNMG